MVDEKIHTHIHDGNYAQRVNFPDLFLYTEPVYILGKDIATTATTLAPFIAPRSMTLSEVYFSATSGLTANDTNYITWTITNLGLDGLGTNAMLATNDLNTTKATGGASIAADTRRQLVVNTDVTKLEVRQGERIQITATATGTLANTVTYPNYLLTFK